MVGGAGSRASAGRAADLEALIRHLRDSGIFVVVQTTNSGMMLTITDRLHNILAEHLIEWPVDGAGGPVEGAATLWLHNRAVALFPDSDYARRESR